MAENFGSALHHSRITCRNFLEVEVNVKEWPTPSVAWMINKTVTTPIKRAKVLAKVLVFPISNHGPWHQNWAFYSKTDNLSSPTEMIKVTTQLSPRGHADFPQPSAGHVAAVRRVWIGGQPEWTPLLLFQVIEGPFILSQLSFCQTNHE